jgi:o-succinylbenzoate---CoA ligase
MPTGPAVLDLLGPLLAALEDGPAIAPVETDGAGPASAELTTVPENIAWAVRTSGSTAAPRRVLLPSSAIRHAAAAGTARLGGPGQWLLTLPADHIAGLMVLARSALGGYQPAVVAPGPFTPSEFADATSRVDGSRRYVSLVPTQLHRLLADEAVGVDALRTYHGVLVGGAALSPALRDQCADAEIALVTSYGMTETCGGCVFDGRPLDGVTVTTTADSRLVVSGPVVATGYLGEAPFEPERTFVTGDRGSVLDDGTIRIIGRADDVIITGGINVDPLPVEQAIGRLAGVAGVVVTGLSDPEWGQVVVAVVMPDGAPPSIEEIRTATAPLGRAAAPRHLVIVDAIPLRGIGKPDRAAIAGLVRTTLGSPGRPARGTADM